MTQIHTDATGPAARAWLGTQAPASLAGTLMELKWFRAMAMVLAGVTILAVSAKISVPFWPVPMTLQTFAIVVLAASCGAGIGVATVLAYLAAGLIGVPVFANTP